MAEAGTKKSPKTRAASIEKKIGRSLKTARAPLATNGKPGKNSNQLKTDSDKIIARKREITLKAFRAAYETHHRKAS